MKLITRAAVKRLAALAAFCSVLVFAGWWTMIRMPFKSYRGALPPLGREETVLRDVLRRDVTALAGEIGERNVFNPSKLRAAADYIGVSLTNAGYTVHRQSYRVSGESCDNLQVEIPGNALRQEIVVVGAHYDSVSGSPGANDNGSGVAALLALAKSWSHRQPSRTVRFVAFANEEPVFFQTSQMGSLVYAKACRERGEPIVAMMSLETMGWFRDAAGSQKYPFPIGLFYPSRGDFIAFVGNVQSARLVRRCVAAFRQTTRFPSEGGALPGSLPGIGWSDHWSFWQAGYEAVMVTDTAPFRYPHYHTPEDTPDKVDYERLARVVVGLDKVLDELANR